MYLQCRFPHFEEALFAFVCFCQAPGKTQRTMMTITRHSQFGIMACCRFQCSLMAAKQDRVWRRKSGILDQSRSPAAGALYLKRFLTDTWYLRSSCWIYLCGSRMRRCMMVDVSWCDVLSKQQKHKGTTRNTHTPSGKLAMQAIVH